MRTLFFTYLLPMSIAIIAFYAGYFLLLRKGSFFQLNRFFLLFALLFSFALPFIHFESQSPIQQISYTAVSEEFINPTTVTIITTSNNESFDWDSFLKTIYIVGIIFMLVKVLVQLGHILFLILKFGIKKENGNRIVVMNNNMPHFSFFKLIFINQNKITLGEEADIIAHEAAHTKQCHFIDLLLLETATAFQWFNPVMWLYKRSLKSIHEYLSDQAVLKTGAEKVNYCQLLVKQTTGFHLENLTNSFYYPSLKNRIVMMTKKQNHRKNMLKLCFALPLFVLLFIAFACNKSTNELSPSEYEEQFEKEYQTTPDHPAVYKNGNKDIGAFFISTLNFDKWTSKITEKTSIEVYFYINQSGDVIFSATHLSGLISSSGDDLHELSRKQMNEMGKWTPAIKNGKPVKSIYIYQAADVLREALKTKGLKVYSAEELQAEYERDQKTEKYKITPDQPAKYKNGESDLDAYFISKIDFKNFKSKITDKSIIQCSFWINESGKIDDVGFECINQGNYTDLDFRIDFEKMGNWQPATKDGKPVKSMYVYDGGDALRKAMKENGLKIYSVKDF